MAVCFRYGQTPLVSATVLPVSFASSRGKEGPGATETPLVLVAMPPYSPTTSPASSASSAEVSSIIER